MGHWNQNYTCMSHCKKNCKLFCKIIRFIKHRTWYGYTARWYTGKFVYTERQSGLLGTSHRNQHPSNPDKRNIINCSRLKWRKKDILQYRHNFRQPERKKWTMSEILLVVKRLEQSVGRRALTGSHLAPFLQLHSLLQFGPNLFSGQATKQRVSF